MTRRVRLCLVAIVLLVAVAGCSSLGDLGADDSTPDIETESAADPGDNTTANETADTEPEVHPDNPYGKETLVVGLNDTITPNDVRPAVADALEYWEEHSAEYAGYPISYDLQPNATDPDLYLDFDESVSVCSLTYKAETVGCAPLVNDSAPDTATIRIEAGYTANSTETIVAHEIGHTLGLDHDDEPAAVMNESLPMTPYETTVEIQTAWLTFSHDRQVIREQLNHTIDYYEAWSVENMETNVTFETTEYSQASLAGTSDFYVLVDDDANACGGPAMCAEYNQDTGTLFSPDYRVRTANVYSDAHGWIAGRYLGDYLGLDADELPEPFQNEDNVRGEWWAS